MATVLAGDIGGTSARLAYFEVDGGALRLVGERVYPSRDFQSLTHLLKAHRAVESRKVERAAFGVAGPVKDGCSRTPNLAWEVVAAELAAALELPDAGLLNDLEANALGIRHLGPEDLVTLQAGIPDPAGHRAVISAGTGLGQAGLFWNGHGHRALASEGGHADFAPRTPLEGELWAHLAARLGHVSWEQVLSGPGLVNVYGFLRDTGGEEPAWLSEALREGDPAAVISVNGQSGKSALCATALDLFVSLYGAAAGNLALHYFATGGVYLGGGIAPKILDRLREGNTFLGAFADKGRMRPLMERIPVQVITEPRTALLGAAHRAAFGED